jgi:hypothetical protein
MPADAGAVYVKMYVMDPPAIGTSFLCTISPLLTFRKLETAASVPFLTAISPPLPAAGPPEIVMENCAVWPARTVSGPAKRALTVNVRPDPWHEPQPEELDFWVLPVNPEGVAKSTVGRHNSSTRKAHMVDDKFETDFMVIVPGCVWWMIRAVRA